MKLSRPQVKLISRSFDDIVYILRFLFHLEHLNLKLMISNDGLEFINFILMGLSISLLLLSNFRIVRVFQCLQLLNFLIFEKTFHLIDLILKTFLFTLKFSYFKLQTFDFLGSLSWLLYLLDLIFVLLINLLYFLFVLCSYLQLFLLYSILPFRLCLCDNDLSYFLLPHFLSFFGHFQSMVVLLGLSQ